MSSSNPNNALDPILITQFQNIHHFANQLYQLLNQSESKRQSPEQINQSVEQLSVQLQLLLDFFQQKNLDQGDLSLVQNFSKAQVLEVEVILVEVQKILNTLISKLKELSIQLQLHPLNETDELKAYRKIWRSFRHQFGTQYHKIEVQLKLYAPDLPKLPQLRISNYTRSIFHASWGLIAVGLSEFLVEPINLIWVSLGFTLLSWTSEAIKSSGPKGLAFIKMIFGPLLHAHEQKTISSATWYATSITICTLLFSYEFLILGVLSLAIGDPMAALIGRKWGRIKLIHRRTLEGSLAFWVSAFFICWLDIFLFHQVSGKGLIFSSNQALIVATSAGLGGSLGELFSKSIDDNFSVPIAAASFAAFAAYFTGINSIFSPYLYSIL
jgi:dolichol kinase